MRRPSELESLTSVPEQPSRLSNNCPQLDYIISSLAHMPTSPTPRQREFVHGTCTGTAHDGASLTAPSDSLFNGLVCIFLCVLDMIPLQLYIFWSLFLSSTFFCFFLSWCDILQHTTTHCTTLQHTAQHCSILQYNTIRCQDTVYQAYAPVPVQHTTPLYNILRHTVKKQAYKRCVSRRFGKVDSFETQFEFFCNVFVQNILGKTVHSSSTMLKIMVHTTTHCNSTWFPALLCRNFLARARTASQQRI